MTKEEFDITPFTAEINELDKQGFKIDKILKNGIVFNCEKNPYAPDELTQVLDMVRKIGNTRFFDRDTMKFKVTNIPLISTQPQANK